ncbi:protein MIS12 homolog [Andrographis paniculata]|uniref:protein MIS12 homolog n=1 Tax=Andrographis paniculata TaxID=175694 RepID=UPI0021E8ABF5|nr:protein MIS12 homolog [Andrographis paniculata]XP_051113704.1 protein MIS12 homolog [Andrographis paniculata]
MEATSGEVVFESLNLSPRLFINEVLNVVDDLLDEAFNYFLQEASKRLKTEGTDRAEELSKGVAYIRDLIQSTLDQRMEKWEEYCIRFCFSVPEGFSLPKANEPSGDDLPDLDVLTDTEVDAQLKSLREKLVLVGKESAELDKELRALERQSLASNKSAGFINEALRLYEKNGAPQMFKELTNMASEFRAKVVNLKRSRTEETQSLNERADKLLVKPWDAVRMPRGNGMLPEKLEELQEFLDEIIAHHN